MFTELSTDIDNLDQENTECVTIVKQLLLSTTPTEENTQKTDTHTMIQNMKHVPEH